MYGPYKAYGEGVWLFSNYMWSIDINLKISSLVKNANPQNITIHGGPSTPSYAAACRQFLDDNNHVDIAVHGEGESAIVEILQTLRGRKNSINALREIDEALQRIVDRTYGICQMTGKPIPKARLEAKPWAKYTIEAARQLEGSWGA